ncbi:MAG: insulinase family protein [Treponema sp.]|nr:insulinase family protein [Treponema sp.]
MTFFKTKSVKGIKPYASFLFLTIILTFSFIGCKSTEITQKESTVLSFNSSIKTDVLSNGMTYFIQHNQEPKNRIILRLVVKAGSCMEEDDQKGVAHFIEHLAFNGTEHFEKSAIVDYFEKIGMNFGSDLNAYTSFEETVYKLEIPASNPEMLETALLILRDWACAISFAQEEIDKERGVVTEEWRLRQGLQGRISDQQIPFLLADSPFEHRLPIGDMEIIKNISRERILDFYKKWYKPEIMSVIVVGDEDIQTLESSIQKIMETIPSSQEKITTSPFTVPAKNEKDILIYQDSEQSYPILRLLVQDTNYHPQKTQADIKDILVKNIATTIFNQRIDEISNTPESTWLDAACVTSKYTNYTWYNYLALIPKTGLFIPSFTAFLDEWDRITQFGITQSELQRLKDYYLNMAEQDYINKDKINSNNHADNLVSHFITGKIIVSEDDYYELYKRIIPEITIEDVNAALVNFMPERGTKLFILAPSDTPDLPTKEQLLDLWKNYSNPEIVAYNDDVTDDNLMPRPSTKGKISSQKDIPELGVKEYIFENGIRILTKQTDFETNRINMSIFSKGGLYLVQDQDIPSAEASANYAILSGLGDNSYNQMIKKITSKQIDLNINIYNTEEGFYGACNSNEFETLAQLVHLYFTKPRFESETWTTLLQKYEESAKNHGVQPDDLFSDKLLEILFNDIRHAPFDLNFVSKMNPETAKKVYLERFENPADFTFVFVGDFDENQLLENCAYYFGTLPTTNKLEETKYIYYDFPKNITSETVYKGLDQQGEVYIAFGGNIPPASNVEETFQDVLLMNQLESLLDIRLREVIREDKGGSYGIGVSCTLAGFPERYYRIGISFGCEPNRAEELTNEVINEIKNLQNNLVSSDYIEKLQETFKRNYETSSRKNNWWISRIKTELVLNSEPMWYTQDASKVPDLFSAEALQKLANKYLNTENYVSVFLKPEQ